ncbi:hypothetical protein BGZ46_003706 [Entomortierella lignicola]|nr:hypothetical protein BGZ46_003706 [Entomortierella lignicola]
MKRVFALKMRIEQHEATLESDPSVKEKMDPDQVEFIGHKLEFIAMLKEMEAVMDLFNQQSSKDIDNQAHLNPVLELENLQYQESSETSLQLVRLFCALQELENNKRFAEKEGASSLETLETLASFRSSLFELANATDVSENKNDEQILHTMAKKLSIASLERVSEGNSATYKIIREELDHILLQPKNIKLSLNDENRISIKISECSPKVIEPCDDTENVASSQLRDIIEPLILNTTLVGTPQPPNEESAAALVINLSTDLNESVNLTSATQLNSNQILQVVPSSHEVKHHIHEETLSYIHQPSQPSFPIIRQSDKEFIRHHDNPGAQGQEGEGKSSHSFAYPQPDHSENQLGRGGRGGTGRSGRRQPQHHHQGGFAVTDNVNAKQQETYLTYTNMSLRAEQQRQSLTNVHVQPIFHQQYYQYPHYYYPGYPANYNGRKPNESDSGDTVFDGRRVGAFETQCQSRSLDPIHEHEEY